MMLTNPWPVVGGVLIATAIGFGTGWTVNGWRLDAKLAEVKQASAENRAKSANAALDQLAVRLNDMHAQATAAQLDVKTLSAKMDLIRKEQRNAQSQKPLPVDCIPDANRFNRLRDAIGAANAAIEGASARR